MPVAQRCASKRGQKATGVLIFILIKKALAEPQKKKKKVAYAMQRLQDTYEEQRFPCCHCPSLAFSLAQDSLASAAAAAAAELLQLRHLLQQVANSLAGAQSLPLGQSLSVAHGCCGAANSLSL